MHSVQDKSVVVTGGAKGIGYNIAREFLENNAKLVIILDFNEEQGEKAIKNLNSVYGVNKAVFYKCDVVKDTDEIFQLITEKYDIDVLVNNAGIINEKSFRKTMDVNCFALVELSIKFFNLVRVDKGGKGGTIINIASVSTVLDDPFLLYYKTSKYAVLGFSKGLGHECNYQWSKVRVISILPSVTRTDIIKGDSEWDEKAKVIAEYFHKFSLQDAEDVGKRVIEVFEKADSGSAWLISGGGPATEVPPGLKISASDLETPGKLSI